MSLRPKAAASESEVGKLHSNVNRIYTNISDKLLTMLDSKDKDEVLVGLSMCSPAMLTSMSGWVKQNDVTCQPEDVETVAKNKELLKDKRKRGAAKLHVLDPTGTNKD